MGVFLFVFLSVVFCLFVLGVFFPGLSVYIRNKICNSSYQKRAFSLYRKYSLDFGLFAEFCFFKEQKVKKSSFGNNNVKFFCSNGEVCCFRDT